MGVLLADDFKFLCELMNQFSEVIYIMMGSITVGCNQLSIGCDQSRF